MLSLERCHKWDFTISAINGCRYKLRYFTAKFPERGAGRGTRVIFICVAQYSPDHNALTCKIYNRVKSRVSNELTEAEMYNSRHFKIGHKSMYGLLKLTKLGSRNGLLPEGNWAPSRLYISADYSWVTIKDALWHLAWLYWKCKIWSLKWGRDKMAVILQTTFSNAFSSIKMFAFFNISHVLTKNVNRNMLSTDISFFGAGVVERSGYLYTISFPPSLILHCQGMTKHCKYVLVRSQNNSVWHGLEL